ncbi:MULTISPECIES: autoinducer binding domain-containing protein [unclassified Sinorhizobium]|uniref:helix-turn-helix transcriptional regulator n=1 Tax=unclassified Sinorhizobium TaxID=2613772 RepID=UPI00352388EB
MQHYALSADVDLLSLVQAFGNACRGLNEVSHILIELDKIRARLGIVNVMSAWLPSRRDRLAQNIRLHGWNSAWLESYDFNDFVHVDPVMKHLRATAFPFIWSQALNRAEWNEAEERVMSHAKDFGMNDGYTVPFWGPRMRIAFVSFGTNGRALAGFEKDALDFLALRLHNWLSENIDERSPIRSLAADSTLSPQEIETLHLLMKGNNYKQIAYLSGLSTRTVEGYVATAVRKLKAHNRTEAVIRALELGYIDSI